MKKIISALLILTMIFSVVCVSTSAAGVIYINENFESMDVFASKFAAGAFYVEDGVLFGYNEARALQTKYEEENSVLLDTEYTWLTYDASMEICVQRDELADTARHIEIAYCNDNPYCYGREDGRVFVSFAYDIDNGCFRLINGLEGTADADQYLPEVAYDIPVDTEEYFTMGISVEKGKMRCFYEGELIFTLDNPDLMIAEEITSPFLFWQRGNFVQITNITVAEHGALFPVTADEPVIPDDSTAPDVSEPDATVAPDNTDAEPSYTDEEPAASDDNAPAASDDNAPVASDDNVPAASDDNAPVASDDNKPVASGTAATNQQKPQGGNSATTGDATFVVVLAMVAALGAAVVVKKVSVK